mmetsp:Transcript_16966/g.38554  ORF Transcript_16966/g.38554 Transcript_16966/m.38554 type:complete len:236 (+) Transcript_16966:164-871(+)
MRRRQELDEHNCHHHTRYEAKEDAIDEKLHVVPRGLHYDVAYKRTNWLAEAREDAPHEGAKAVALGIVDGESNAEAFRDIVDGNGHSEGNAHSRIRQGAHEGCQTLRKVVKADRKRRVQAHALQLLVGLSIFVLRCRFRCGLRGSNTTALLNVHVDGRTTARLRSGGRVRAPRMGEALVVQAMHGHAEELHEDYAPEEAHRGGEVGIRFCHAVVSEGTQAFLEDLDERDVEHDTS